MAVSTLKQVSRLCPVLVPGDDLMSHVKLFELDLSQ